MGPVLNLALHKVSKGHDSAWNISRYGSYFTVTSFCTKLKTSLTHWQHCSCSTSYKLQNQKGSQYSDWSSTHIHKSKLYCRRTVSYALDQNLTTRNYKNYSVAQISLSISIVVYIFNFFGLFGVNRVLSLCIQDISKKKFKSSFHNNYNIQDRAKRKRLFFLLKNYLTHFCPTSTMMAYLQLKLISIDTLFIPIDGTLILVTCWQFHVILTPFSSDVSFCIGIATKLANRGNSDAKIHPGNGEMENSWLYD